MQRKIRLNPSMVKEFIRITSGCDFDIDIASYNRYFVDAKSIVGVLGLDMTHELTVSYDGYSYELENFMDLHAEAC